MSYSTFADLTDPFAPASGVDPYIDLNEIPDPPPEDD
jgi:hypothetical protein